MAYGSFHSMVSSVCLRILFAPLGLVSNPDTVASEGEGMVSPFLRHWKKEKVRDGDSNLPYKVKSTVI